jgi:hypothetical protein
LQCWSQSNDFLIYNYNTSVVVGRLERFFKEDENIFCFQNALGYVIVALKIFTKLHHRGAALAQG